MDKYIVALLNNNLRVIIPDFGAFIIRQKDPKIIVFNEFLKYNDGLLFEYMLKSDGIELDIARQQLSAYTEQAAKVLETGGTFSIVGLGMLRKDKSSKIIFIPESEINAPEEPKHTMDESVMLIEDEEPAQKTNTGIKPKYKPKPKSKDKQAPIAKSGKVPEPEKSIEANTIEPQPVEPLPNESLPVEPVGLSAQQPVKEVHSGRNVNQILKWVIIVLFANVAILAWFIFRDNFRNLFKDKKNPVEISDSVFQQLSDSVRDAAADTSLIFEDASDTISISKIDPVQGSLRYYIVAGCFRDEINADELVKALKIKGFKAEKFGKIGNLYAVCFASFDNKELAVRELNRIREEIHPEAWMTRF